jgi:hypothetical protein
MSLEIWKKQNHPDRMRILYDFANLCYRFHLSVDRESINLLKKWIAEAKSTTNRDALSEGEMHKSNIWIERIEMQLEMCEFWRKIHKTKGNAQTKYAEEQMDKLYNADQFCAKEIRKILDAFYIRLKQVSRNGTSQEYCIAILDRLEQIEFLKNANWIYHYRLFIYYCYSTLADTTAKDSNKKHEIADRMQIKYRQLIEVSNEIFAGELNNPFRIVIIDDYSILSLYQYRQEIMFTECVAYLRSITAIAKSQSKRSLTVYEWEQSRWQLERIEKRLEEKTRVHSTQPDRMLTLRCFQSSIDQNDDE